MIRRPPRSTLSSSSAGSDVYKRQSLDCVDFGAMDRAATDPYPQHRRESIPKTIRSRTSEIASTPFLGTDPLQMRSSSPSPMSTSPVLQGIPRTGLWHMNNFRINVPNNQLRPSDAMGVYPESTEVSPLDERDERRTLPLPPGAQTPMLAYPSSPYCLLYTSPSPRD